MTIHLSKELENSIQSLVLRGQFSSVDEAMGEAARLLLRRRSADGKSMTPAEFDRYLLDAGLMSQVPDTDADFDDPDDQAIAIEGEPISETILRERR